MLVSTGDQTVTPGEEEGVTAAVAGAAIGGTGTVLPHPATAPLGVGQSETIMVQETMMGKRRVSLVKSENSSNSTQNKAFKRKLKKVLFLYGVKKGIKYFF